MQLNPSFKNGIYAGLGFFVTLFVLSVWYAAYNLSTENPNATLTSAKWNAVINAVNDLDGRVSSLTAGSFWTTVTGGIGYSSGSVGIGTTNPGAKLEVNGNIIAADPTVANQVATKGYVDTKVSAAGGGSIIGGGYLISANGTCYKVNPVTGGCNCSSWFTSAPISISVGTGGNYDVYGYICYK